MLRMLLKFMIAKEQMKSKLLFFILLFFSPALAEDFTSGWTTELYLTDKSLENSFLSTSIESVGEFILNKNPFTLGSHKKKLKKKSLHLRATGVQE